MDVLICLASEPGRVVSKEELLEAVWGGAFVEEGALSQAIHSLRKALGDDARQPRYIQTIPKRGYRLVASVSHKEEGEDERAGASVEVSSPSRLEPRRSFRGLNRGLLLLAILGIAVIVASWLVRERLGANRSEPTETDPIVDDGTRIVVLPFENIGKPEDDFFADGLTEEITKDLASFASLVVISRTSAMRYEGADKSLPEIGQELSVDYVLEGTVRWAQGPEGRPRVRITPQLIRVEDDAHVWAQSFDREVEDIFKVQAEISRRVISQLGIALMPSERTLPRPQPTENLEAYRAYVRGLEFKNQPFYSEEYLRKAVPMFERAVKLDPGFAVAWAELSQAHSYLAFNSDPSPSQVERARQALEQAVALDSDLPEVRLAQAYFTYRCLEDFKAAHEQLATAARLSPNDAEVLQSLGLVLRRRGQLVEAIDAFQRAFSLDPHTLKLVWSIAETYRALRNYEQADRYFAQAISLAPDQLVFWEERALNRLAWTGNLEEARAVLEEAPVPGHPGLVSAAIQLDLYERKFERAFTRLSSERMRELAPQAQSRISTLAVMARERFGDNHGALAAAEANRVTLEARIARFPREPFYRAYLALTLAQLGREAEALVQAEHAVQQAHHDAFSGPRMVEIQAMVDAVVGRRHEAVARLARLLARPYQASISTVDLQLNPVWDSLRGYPEFEKLIHHSVD